MSAAIALRQTLNEIVLAGRYDDDLALGQALREAAESLQFAVGDWVNAMTKEYDGSQRSLATDMSRVTGIPSNGLRRYATVAAAYKVELRSANLTYSHHKAAAAADDPQAILRAAEDQGLSVRDTERLAKGLPLGGEDTAQKESSATVPGASMEEAVLEALRTAELYLTTAANTVQKAGFRLTVPVAQSITTRLEAISRPFLALEQAVEAEAGAYL